MKYLEVDTAKRISKIGLGTWQFGASEWGYGEPYAEQEARAIVRRALDLGVTLFDTAEIYSSGRTERILGRALGESRRSVFLPTKMFPVVPGAFVVRQRAMASAHRLGVSRQASPRPWSGWRSWAMPGAPRTRPTAGAGRSG
jgi:aryl-alcohol dehydrogenase-like predicted oxidoreductase